MKNYPPFCSLSFIYPLVCYSNHKRVLLISFSDSREKREIAISIRQVNGICGIDVEVSQRAKIIKPEKLSREYFKYSTRI